jgi:acetylornithine deacetylase
MDPLPLLRDLVAVNSVNPSLVPGAPGEQAAAEVCARAMREAGLDVTFQDVRPGRPNVIGIRDSGAAGPTVMLCGHTDTVGVDGMIEPFAARIANGRLYGRGAQDMKAGVAAMIAAAGLVAPRISRGRVIVACVVDEEHESLGAEALVTACRADAAIITEPTGLELAIAHKGFAWIEIATRGRAAHGSRPGEGRDAIIAMGHVLSRLAALDRSVQARAPVPLMGVGSLHASIIHGGRELSSYPAACVLQMERRTVGGETGETALSEVQSVLDDLRRQDAEVDATARLLTFRGAYRLDPSHELATVAASALRRAGRSGTPIGMSFWTDAAILADAGIPTVLIGPGGAGLHSTTEYVNVDDVYACRDVLADTVIRLLLSSSLSPGS